MNAPASTVDRELVARLRLAVMRLARRLRQESQEGLSPSTLSALATIARHGSVTLGELAERERVQPPTVTRVVARLANEGLIERTTDPGDRRVARVRLTDAGERRLTRARARQADSLEARIRRLEDADMEQIGSAAAVLERLLEDEL